MQNMAIQFTGKILIDLIPHIYDTKRTVRILGEDGEEQQIMIDPNLKEAFKQMEHKEEAKVSTIFNPSVGAYDVVAECGSNYDTRRQEAFSAMSQMIAQQPQLAQVIGDLYMGSADFPNADKLQERMRNWIPPAILGTGPSETEQALTAQLQQAQQVIAALTQQVQDKSIDQKMEKQRLDMDALNHLAIRLEKERDSLISAFKAETERLKALITDVNPVQMGEITSKMVSEIEGADNPARDFNPDRIDPSQYLQAEIPTITG